MSNSSLKLVRGRRGGAAIAVVVILALAAIAFAVYWFALRGGGGGAAAKLALKRIPASAQVVGGLDVQALLKSDFLKQAAAQGGVPIDELTAKLRDKGVDVSKIASIAFGAVLGEDGPTSVVALGTGTFDASQLKGALGAAEGALTAGGGAEVAQAFQKIEIIDGNVVVAGGGPLFDETIALAGGKGASAADDPAVAELRAKIDTGATFWVSGVVPEAAQGQFKAVASMAAGLGVPTHFALSGEVGSGLALTVALRFDGDVEKAVSGLDGMLSAASAFASGPEGEMLKSLKLSASGPILVASVTVPEAFIKQAAAEGERSPR